MSTYAEFSTADPPHNVGDPVAEADLERVLHEVPRGAFAVAAVGVALLLAGWLWLYFGLFLPRGPVS